MVASFSTCMFEAAFFLELAIRFAVCPVRWSFLFEPYNLIDLGSALPLIPRLLYAVENRPADSFIEAVRSISPVLISLKWLRRFTEFKLLVSAFTATVNALPVLLYTLILIAF